MSVLVETGQRRAKLILDQALTPDSDTSRAAAHAYLFAGPAGVGKADVALSFAAALLTQDRQDTADIEARVRRRAHPDLVWIEPRGAHEILVDDIRTAVVREASLQPFEGTCRVFVIAEAHLMNDEAANSLLKTLEEPPAYVHIILTSSQPDALPETVRSRCQEVPFAGIGTKPMIQALKEMGVDGDELQELCALSEGSLGKAQHLVRAEGRKLRDAAANFVRKQDQPLTKPWLELLELGSQAGKEASDNAIAQMDERLETLPASGRERQVLKRDYEQLAKRAERRIGTQTLKLEIELVVAILRRQITQGSNLIAAIKAIEDCVKAIEQLQVNVGAELVLQVLWYRIQDRLYDNDAY